MNVLARLVLLCLVFACGAVRADTPMTLYKAFAGNINFVGTQATLRDPGPGVGNRCRTYNQGNLVYATISIPTGSTVLSAQVHFAGSSWYPRYYFYMDGVQVTAPASRQYFADGDPTVSLEYFGFGADVTGIVNAKSGGPSGTYSFYGIQVDENSPWCSRDGVVGGYTLVVVYSNPAEAYRVVNLYEGLKYQKSTTLETQVTMSNFKVPATLGSTKAKVGYVTWGGHSSATSNAEYFQLNSVPLLDTTYAPGNNPFNGRSSVNGDTSSDGLDFDTFVVGSSGGHIAAGQTSATTKYSAGSDFVLLGAQFLAIPSTISADLSLSLTRNNSLILNSPATYTFGVSNNGPSTEAGTVTVDITVTGTLNGAVSFAGTNANWVCNTASVPMRCTNTTTSGFASGTSLPNITLTLTPGSAGSTITVSGTVAGPATSYDYQSTNNSVSDSALVSAVVAPSAYVFTDAPCTDNVAFGASQPCKALTWPTLRAGATKSGIYVTAVDASGVPSKFGSVTSKSVQFGLSCVNPASDNGTAATVGSSVGSPVTLPACAAGGAVPSTWSSGTHTMNFTASSPTATEVLNFKYADVGSIRLSMRVASTAIKTGDTFVQIPNALAITTDVTTTTSETDNVVFGIAGAAFTMHASALTLDGSVARNFGRETTPETPLVDTVTSGSVNTTVIPSLSGSFSAPVNGKASGSAFTWDEVGIMTVTPKLPAASIYTAAHIAGVSTTMTPAVIGRFKPASFRTEVVAPMATCPARMGCPAGVGAAYSGQPFTVKVSAYTSTGSLAKNYQGDLARVVTLFAYDASGGVVANPPAATPGKLGSATAAATAPTVQTAAFVAGVGSTPAAPTDLRAVYNFPAANAFVNTAPQARNWVTPTTIYLRALDTQAVTSDLGPVNAIEGGVRIVSGRLQVDNIHGSELLPVPVNLTAQYWGGSYWETSTSDAVTTLDPSKMSYPACSGNLCTATAAARQLYPNSIQTLSAGSFRFHLRALGAGKDGTLDTLMTEPAWLPSTKGKIKLGVNRSPLLYMRESF